MIAELGTSRLSDAVNSSTENLSKHYEEPSCSEKFLGISIMKQGLLLPEGVGQVIQSNQNNTLASLGSKVSTIVTREIRKELTRKTNDINKDQYPPSE